MKKIFLFFITILCTETELYSQSRWIQQYSGIDGYLNSVYFVNQNTGWVAGSDTINGGRAVVLKTTNGGTNWFIQFSADFQYFNSVRFVDQNTGCVAGTTWYSLGQSGVIYRTTNAGINWNNQFYQSWRSLYSLYFIDQNTGWVVGDITSGYKSLVMKTTNGGIYWFFQTSAHYDVMTLFSVYFVNNNTGWAVGGSLGYDSTIIINTTNGGTNWFRQGNTTSSKLYSTFFINQNTGWAVGYNQLLNAALMLKTTNAGATWNNINSITYYGLGLNSIIFMDQNTGFAVGGGNRSGILKTTNGGLGWKYEYKITNNSMNSIYFADQNTGWAVGDNGTILQTTNAGGPIGIQLTSNKIPDQYFLSQNYPNPFNPTTNIQFTIPLNKGGLRGLFVTLKIYDILGREITSLFNEQLKPGSYEVRWDASNYPSGVYFYKLQTDDFVQTKKLILLK